MKQYASMTCAIFLIKGTSFALPDDPAEYAAWEARQLASIEQQRDQPQQQSIPTLGKLIYKLSLPNQMEEGDRVVYTAARDLLLSIPGHAQWFGSEIKRMTDLEVQGFPSHHERAWHFTTLSNLESPETIKVLGELLTDERNPFAGTSSDAPWIPSCLHAVVALHDLELENPPVRTKHSDAHNNLRTWQLWFEQVRAGTRTISFKGDNTIYSLSGPVATARDPGPVLPEDRASTDPLVIDSGTSTSSRTPSLIALTLAILALVLAATRAFRRRTA